MEQEHPDERQELLREIGKLKQRDAEERRVGGTRWRMLDFEERIAKEMSKVDSV